MLGKHNPFYVPILPKNHLKRKVGTIMSVRKDSERGTWFYEGKIRKSDGSIKGYKKRGFKTKKQAKMAEMTFLKSIKEEHDSLTLQEVVDIYEQRLESLPIKESTLYSDLIYYNKHIKDFLGNRKVNEITPNIIEIWIGEFKEKKKDDGTSYKVNTINHAKSVLSKFMTYAKRLNLIQYNPVSAVPNLKDSNPVTTKKDSEENFWELDEYNAFMNYVDDPYWIDVFSFLFQTGVREGEMFALTWKNVNLIKGTVFIAQNISNKTRTGKYIVVSPKNERSIRTIILSEQMKEMLNKRYQHQRKKDGFNRDYYVFGDVNPLSRNKLARNLDKYIDISGVKRITPHGFRHSHASLLIYNKVDDSVIAERLGHTIEELHETYAHIYNDLRTEMKDKLDEIFK